ncbi:MAG: hypothetical protein RMN51_10575 [Verrucomicrobiota bacterium]|nr:hypothetical protein [Limisphaera sp.]MDW8382531.1 hypothetical protein [Verrucomicrobiota bacterium]
MSAMGKLAAHPRVISGTALARGAGIAQAVRYSGDFTGWIRVDALDPLGGSVSD